MNLGSPDYVIKHSSHTWDLSEDDKWINDAYDDNNA